jgi:hypothetical protein
MTIMRNKRKRALLSSVLGALVIFSATWASAAVAPPLPGMTVQIGSESFQVGSSLWSYDATLDTFSLTGPFVATTTDGSTFTINSAEAIPDPLLFFAGSATNNTNAPLSYSIAFNSPLLPNLLGPVDSHAELGLTLTDGLNDGATVQPTTPGGKMLTSFDLYSNGTPISKNVNIGDLFSILSGTAGTTFSADNSLVCGQACVTMSAIMSFTLTGQDAVGFSGKVVQTSPVPLPGAVLLFGSGLLGLAGALRKKINLA